jgi:catechol 2,3-dioxygenase-like lactoylglutathione lyase family enzyme
MAKHRAKKSVVRAKSANKAKSGPELAFNHAIVYVSDLARAMQFYADRLGLPVLDRFENAYARLRTSGDGTMALHVVEPGQQVASEGIRLYFEVKNLEKFCANLQTAGVSFTSLPKMMPWGWKHAYLDDPDGHEISLYWAGQKRFHKTTMKRTATA